MSHRRFAPAGVLVVFVASLLAATGRPAHAAGKFEGKEPPELLAPQWLNSKTRNLTLKSLRGKAVVVFFFATWCDPAMPAIPPLNEMHAARAKDGLAVVGIHGRVGAEKSKEVDEFAKKHKIVYPIGLDLSGQTQSAYGVAAMPWSFVVDPTGVCVWEGNPTTDKPGFEAAVARALEGARSDVVIEKRTGGTAALDPAYGAIEIGNIAEAIARLRKLVRTGKEKTDREIAEAYIGDLEAVAREAVARADALVAAGGRLAEAEALLTDTALRFRGLQAAKTAEEKLKELLKKGKSKG